MSGDIIDVRFNLHDQTVNPVHVNNLITALLKSIDNEISFMGHSQGCLVGLEFASRFPKLIKSLVLVGGSYELPVNPALINFADGGDMKSVELMMKWGYEGVKKFIGGNPVQKIINSPRQVQEGLAIDLRAVSYTHLTLPTNREV